MTGRRGLPIRPGRRIMVTFLGNGKLCFGCTEGVLERSLASLSWIVPAPGVQVGSGVDNIIILYAAQPGPISASLWGVKHHIALPACFSMKGHTTLRPPL